MGIAALVLGIIGLLVSLVPFLGVVAFPLAILALIFGGLAIRAKAHKGIGIAGLVTGLLALGFAFFQHSNNKKLASEVDKLGAELKEELKKNAQTSVEPAIELSAEGTKAATK